MKRLLLAGCLLACLAAGPVRAGGSRLIQASATLIRVGDLRADIDPTLGAAVQAFARPSSCRTITLESGSIVHWNRLGIGILTATLGDIPNGRDACTYPGMPIRTITMTGRAWTTSLGLHVGDSVEQLQRLYPRARYQVRNLGEGAPGNSYALVTYRTACIGVCRTRMVTAARLLAQVRGGRVVKLVMLVGAQGE